MRRDLLGGGLSRGVEGKVAGEFKVRVTVLLAMSGSKRGARRKLERLFEFEPRMDDRPFFWEAARRGRQARQLGGGRLCRKQLQSANPRPEPSRAGEGENGNLEGALRNFWGALAKRKRR